MQQRAILGQKGELEMSTVYIEKLKHEEVLRESLIAERKRLFGIVAEIAMDYAIELAEAEGLQNFYWHKGRRAAASTIAEILKAEIAK
jgi:hypothetical protein